VRDDVLHSHRLSRTARDHRTHRAEHRIRTRAPGPASSRNQRRLRRSRMVLAFRRRSLGGGGQRGLPVGSRRVVDAVMRSWGFYPSVIIGCAALAVGYLISCLPDRSGLVWFFLGELVLLLALISPLDILSDNYLFSAHMVQHMLLILAAPPLMIMGLTR